MCASVVFDHIVALTNWFTQNTWQQIVCLRVLYNLNQFRPKSRPIYVFFLFHSSSLTSQSVSVNIHIIITLIAVDCPDPIHSYNLWIKSQIHLVTFLFSTLFCSIFFVFFTFLLTHDRFAYSRDIFRLLLLLLLLFLH